MTRTVEPQKTMTDGTAPGVGDRDAIPSDRYFTDHPVESRGTTVLRHYRFHTRDPEAARRFLEDAYKPGWRIDGLAPDAAVTQRRCDTGLITVDEVRIEGRASCDIRATDRVVVIRPLAGSMTVDSEPPERLDDPLLVADGLPCVLQTNAVRLAVVCIDVNLLRNVARKRNAPLPQQIEFLSSRPQSPSAVRAWDQAAEYVGATFACEKTAQRPLIVAAVAELLVAATLECFPSNLTGGEELLHDAGRPAAFKGAVSFIDQHAGPGIGINDVAAAVGLTPRAVQYLFRQQLTPLRPSTYVASGYTALIGTWWTAAVPKRPWAKSHNVGASPTPAASPCSTAKRSARARTTHSNIEIATARRLIAPSRRLGEEMRSRCAGPHLLPRRRDDQKRGSR